MSLKLKFVLSIAIVVALVSFISAAVIYNIYSKTGEDVFYKKLVATGLDYERIINQSNDKDKADQVKIISNLSDLTLEDESVAVFDSNANVINLLPNDFNVLVSKKNILSVKNIPTKLQFFKFNLIYCSVQYIPQTKHFAVASGNFQQYAKRYSFLKNVLLTTSLIGLLLVALVSYIFVSRLLKPIILLSKKMNDTNALQLKEKFVGKKGKDEIAEIGNSYNTLLERLQAAFETQKTFVHHASHELKTPLAVMMAQTELALKKDLEINEHKQLLQSLYIDQKSLIQLTNSLLLLSQYESLSSKAAFVEIRVDELILETISAAEKLYAGINILFEFDSVPTSDKEICIKGNATLLKSAFDNLIKNAYLYSANKKIIIRLNFDTARVLVHFDSEGKALQSTIDELKIPFFRGENSTQTKGYGIGLSIVESIAKIHEGNLIYVSINDNINRFSLVFSKQL